MREAVEATHSERQWRREDIKLYSRNLLHLASFFSLSEEKKQHKRLCYRRQNSKKERHTLQKPQFPYPDQHKNKRVPHCSTHSLSDSASQNVNSLLVCRIQVLASSKTGKEFVDTSGTVVATEEDAVAVAFAFT